MAAACRNRCPLATHTDTAAILFDNLANAVTFITSLTFYSGHPEERRRQFNCTARKINKMLVCFGVLRILWIEVGVYFG